MFTKLSRNTFILLLIILIACEESTNSGEPNKIVYGTPDFQIGQVIIDSVDVKKVYFHFKLLNNGLGAVNLYDTINHDGIAFKFYYSEDMVLTNGDKLVGSGQFAGTDSILFMNDSTIIYSETNAIVDTARYKYIGIEIDTDNLFSELNENNNKKLTDIIIKKSDPFTPIIYGTPDFVIGNMKIDSVLIDKVYFTFNLKNMGLGAVNLEGDLLDLKDNPIMQHYLSAGPSVQSARIAAGGYTYSASRGETIILAGDSIQIQNIAYAVNDTIQYGPYPYIMLDFDIGDDFQETNEDNNIGFLKIID